MATPTTTNPYAPNAQKMEFRQKMSELLRKRKDPEYVRYAFQQMGYDDNLINSELGTLTGKQQLQVQDQTGINVGGTTFQPQTYAEAKQYQDDQNKKSLLKDSATNDLNDKLGNLKSLLEDTEGLKSAVGSGILGRGANLSVPFTDVNLYTDPIRQRFVGTAAKLLTTETLDTLINAKSQGATFGALSEGELNLLRDSASVLNAWSIKDSNGNIVGFNASEEDFKKELEKMQKVTKKAFDNVQKPDATVQQSQQSSQLTLNTPQEAAQWLQNNPNDPRADQVRQKLQSVGYSLETNQTTPTDTQTGGQQSLVEQDVPLSTTIADKIGSFLGIKKFGQGIGTAAFLFSKEGRDLQKKAQEGDKNAIDALQGILQETPSAKEIIGSAALTALNAASGGLAGKALGTVGKVAAAAGTGYAYDVAGSLEQNRSVVEALTPGLGTAIGTVAGSLSAFKAIKDAQLPEQARKAVGQIIQGKTKDIEPALRALSSIDSKQVKTYEDASKALKGNVKSLGVVMDNILSQDQAPKLLSELDNVANVGGKEVRTNFVKQALENLDELYTKTNDPIDAQKMKNILEKANNEGLTLKEINDIAKRYGTEFGKKAFSKATGDPLTSVNAVAYENTRKGIKDSVRNLLPDDTAKQIDAALSDNLNTQQLVEKMVEKVNGLKQKIGERGILEKAGIKIGKAADLATGHSLRGLAGGLFPSNVGLKTMNSVDLQNKLSENLALIEKLNKNLDNPTFIDKLKKGGRKLTFTTLLNAARELTD